MMAVLQDPRIERGAARFNAGDFFVAHEIWEAAWLDAVDQEKDLLQNLVRIAAGYAKVESGIRGGALKLLARGLEGLHQWLHQHPTSTLEAFAAAVEADLERVRAGSSGPISLATVHPPQLALHPTD
jgi:uncharacterized protein